MTGLNDTDLLAANQEIRIYLSAFFGSHTAEDDEREAFRGHVLPLNFQFDATGSRSEFLAQTTDGFLRRAWCQGIGFADRDTTAREHYHQFDSVTGGGERMTLGRIVRHLLGYYDSLGAPPATNPDWVAHTNLVYHATENPLGWINLDDITTTPFTPIYSPDGSMRADRYIVRETSNLWSRLKEIATNEFFVIYFTKDNHIHYIRHPMYAVVPPDPVMTFDQSFSVGKPVVEIRSANRIRQTLLHAVTDDGDTMHAEYPVSPTWVYGNIHEQTYLRCNDQSTLDEWARVHYLFENRDYTVRWTAPGYCGLLFDILDPVLITYTGTAANGVHIDWTDKRFWIHEIYVDPKPGFTATTTFVLEEDAS